MKDSTREALICISIILLAACMVVQACIFQTQLIRLQKMVYEAEVDAMAASMRSWRAAYGSGDGWISWEEWKAIREEVASREGT